MTMDSNAWVIFSKLGDKQTFTYRWSARSANLTRAISKVRIFIVIWIHGFFKACLNSFEAA